MTVTREQMLERLHVDLEALPWVNAAWLGGSDAFGATDSFSDIDLVLDVADGRIDDAFAAVEASLEGLAPIFAKWLVPEPAWHGHHQRFYRLRGAPETALVDLLVMERGSPAKRLDEREQHGEPGVLFDRLGIVRSTALDRAAHSGRLAARRAALDAREALFAGFVLKEIRRGRALDAAWAYQAFLFAPLVEVLRMRHCPERFHFGQRYLQRDLPPEVVARLETLAFPRGLEHLEQLAGQARAWLRAELDRPLD